MAKAKASTLGVGSASTTAGRGVSAFGTAMGIAAGVGGALALVKSLQASIKAAIDFESSFAGVRKTVDATEGEFQTMARELRNMATEIPVNVNELNRIAEAAGQLGIRKDAIVDFTETMAMLGATTNLSAEEAATSLARLANIMGTNQDHFDRLGSTIVELGNNMATTEAEIVQMGLRLAGAGEQIGLTEAQVLAFAGTLTSLGINAEAGGTAFSRVFLNMGTAVAAGGAELQRFAEVAGQTSSQFATAFREDAAQAIAAFIAGLGRASDSGQNLVPILDELELGEIRVRDALIRTSNASDLLTDALSRADTAWQQNRAAVEEAEKRFQTTESQLQIMKNQFNDLKIALGSRLTPAVGASAQAMGSLFGALTDLVEPSEKAKQWWDTVTPAVDAATGAIKQFNTESENLPDTIAQANWFFAQQRQKIDAAHQSLEAWVNLASGGDVFDPISGIQFSQGNRTMEEFQNQMIGANAKVSVFGRESDLASKAAMRWWTNQQALGKEIQDSTSEIEQANPIIRLNVDALQEALKAEEATQQAAFQEMERIKDTREEGLRHLEDIITRTKDLYRERADAALDAYNTEVQGARDATEELLRNERENLRIALKDIDTKTGEEADALKAKIKLINDEDKRIREQERERDRQQQRERLRNDIAAAEAEGNADRIADARQRLAEFERDLTIARAAEERAADRERLQEELQALQESARNKADALREDFETLQRNKADELREIEKSEKAKLDAAMATIEEQRDAELQRLDDAKALLEERTKNEIEGQQALVESLEAFGPEWKALGEHLGAEYLVGIQSMINQVQLIPPQILPMVPPNIRREMERTTSEAQVRSQVQAAMSRESSEREAIEAASSMDTSEQREAASSVSDAGHTRESLRDDGFSDDTIDKAFGKDFARGGITSGRGPFLVGERGPELVDLPGGSRVTPNHQLRQMAAGNVINITVPIHGPVYGFLDFENQAIDALKTAIDAGALRGYIPDA